MDAANPTRYSSTTGGYTLTTVVQSGTFSVETTGPVGPGVNQGVLLEPQAISFWDGIEAGNRQWELYYDHVTEPNAARLNSGPIRTADDPVHPDDLTRMAWVEAEIAAAGGGGSSLQPWEGILVAAYGDGNPLTPDVHWGFQNTVASVAAPTQTGIGTAIGRIQRFVLRTPITVNRLRYFGLAAVAAGYTFAVYRGDTGARLFMVDPLPVAIGWNAVTIAGVVLPANVPLWVGIGAKATGTVAAFRSPAAPIASSLGLATLPGSLNNLGPRYGQVALTAGAWPATLPAVAAAAYASAGATGTIPIFFLDNSTAA